MTRTMTRRRWHILAALGAFGASHTVSDAFVSPTFLKNSPECVHSHQEKNQGARTSLSPRLLTRRARNSNNNNNEWSDFDDFVGDDNVDDSSSSFRSALQDRASNDLSGCQQRQFSLGADLTLADYVGSLGFDEVTDWEYYTVDEDEDGNRVDTTKKVVQPNPLDPNQPKRTRESSGSVVRIFRGELEGPLGSTLRSQGLDRRVLVKEFSGELALDLARGEWESVGKLQSRLLLDAKKIDPDDDKGSWVETAASRSANVRKDNANLMILLQLLSNESYSGILGEVNLAELEGNWDPNEFYRALGVPPPKPGAVWIVYEYTGLSTLVGYCRPALKRQQSLPVQRGLFGNPIPPGNLPPWKERARYVVRGIMQQALEAVAQLHESNIAHRSIGRSSLILGSVAMDKAEASSLYAMIPARLVVKLTDLGFSSALQDYNDDLLARAKTFGFSAEVLRKDPDAVAAFAVAEDLHALGFVFVGLLLTALAEIPVPEYNMPATDEDTLQRLMGDIFGKDMDQFRDYVDAEDQLWSNVVQLLDEYEGWMLLEEMCFARERVAKDYANKDALTARALLASKMFQS